jgi:ferredoxin
VRNIPSQTIIYQDRCPNTKRDNLKVCNICEKYCPVDAITINGNIQILFDKCIECGICSAQCPNDVFHFHFISDHILHEKILEILRPNNSIFFQCDGVNGRFKTREQNTNHENIITVPCLGSISEMSILFSFIMSGVNPEFGECPGECRNHQGVAAYKRVLRLASIFLDSLNITSKSLGNNDSSMLIKDVSYTDRRQFINNFRSKLSETLKEVLIPMALVENFNKNPPQKQLESPYSRRKLLLDFTEHYGISSYLVKKREVPFAEITIKGDRCTFCGICSHFCPTSALIKTETKSTVSLDFVFGLCLGCELCVEICPEKVIQVGKTVDLGLLNVPLQKLIQRKILICSTCNSNFIEDSSSDICLSCRKRKQALGNS